MRQNLFWIYTKLAQKELLFQPAPEKEFVTGEGFYYLGQAYRLLLTDERVKSQPTLSLQGDRFVLLRDHRPRAAHLFARWYAENGRIWLQTRIQKMAPRIGVEIPELYVRDLGYRWGSCSRRGAARGRLNIHWRAMQLPPIIIDYILAHEMVHLCEPHHGPEFWRGLLRLMPDYPDRKEWLARNGSRY